MWVLEGLGRPAVKWLDGVDGGHNIDRVGREWNDRGFVL